MPTNDHRGTRCRVADVLPDNAVHTGIGGGTPVWYWIAFYVAVGAVAGVVAYLWLVVVDPFIGSTLGFRTRAYGAAGAASVTSIVTSLVLRHQLARRRWDRFSQLHLEEGRCPSCAYELGELPPEPDGCVLCPECGAAWHTDTIGDDAPPHPDR